MSETSEAKDSETTTVEVVENVADAHEGANGCPETNPSQNAARDWFKSLSAIERSASMGFADGPATIALLQHTAPSPNFENRTTDGRHVQPGFRINWSLLVSLNEIEKMYEGSEAGPAVTQNSGVDSNAHAQGLEPNDIEKNVNANGDANVNNVPTGGVESDDGCVSEEFRIRTLSTGDGSDAALTDLSPSKLHATDVELLMGQTCSIFPSAFHFSSNVIAAFDDAFPFITLRYHETAGNHDDCLDIFDKILEHHADGNGHMFLDGSRIRSSFSWFEHLRSFYQSTSRDSFPLCIFLVLRFEYSALCAFASTSTDQASVNSSDFGMLPSSLPSLISSEDSNNKLASTAGETVSPKLSRHIETLIEMLKSVASASQGLPNVVSNKHKFADMLPDEDSVSNGTPSHLLATPVRFLFDRLHTKQRPFDAAIRIWNDDLGQFLQEFENNPNASLPAAESTSSGKSTIKIDKPKEDNLEDDLAWIDEPSTSAPATQKKNARRKKKKKKKNGGNNAKPAAEKQQPAPAPVSLPEDIEKAEGEQLDLSEPNSIEEPIETIADATLEIKEDTVEELKGTINFDDEDSATSSQPTNEDKRETNSTSQAESGIHISQLKGIGVTCVVGAAASDHDAGNADDSSAWETVEVGRRGNKKKSWDRKSGQQSNVSGLSATGKKSKMARTPASRKRNANRKFAREIISSVLDAVEDEANKKKELSRENWQASSEKWVPPSSREKAVIASKTAKVTNGNTLELKADDPTPKPSKSEDSLTTPRGRGVTKMKSEEITRRVPSDVRKAKKDGKCCGQANPADQNTAPTVQETLSAVSANSTGIGAAYQPSSHSQKPVHERDLTQNDSSSSESIDVAIPQSSSPGPEKQTSPSPPLPTLLSPENANSASSSVASSLEAPHAGRHRHFSSANENNVGYHLLNVCDRLSRDMNVFMARRSHALNIRRKERGVILSALQDCVSTLWPSQCSVDLYGSCATLLDLPSSDLDVVVCGLPWDTDTLLRPQSNEKQSALTSSPNDGSKKNSTQTQTKVPSKSRDIKGSDAKSKSASVLTAPPLPQNQMSLNAERVSRLARELERQPWAVQVKAIPTARVPVVKILADPARLSGSSVVANGDGWMMDQHQMGQDAQMPSEYMGAPRMSHNNDALPNYHLSQWRGADVVNGLFKVDITFEGPEHGGISSTEFSARVVQEFCDETKLPPEATPAVQTLMVLKELLAQRRLNEPFLGGLSSYALLLLVISMIRERVLIREELERVERHMQKVTAKGGASTMDSTAAAFEPRKLVVEKNDTPITQTRKKADTNLGPPTIKQQQTKSVPTVETNSKNQPKQSQKLQATMSMAERISNAINGSGNQHKNSSGDLKNNQKKTNPGSAQRGKSGTPSSSWASIAKKKGTVPQKVQSTAEVDQARPAVSSKTGKDAPPEVKARSKIGTFADAVAKGAPKQSKRQPTPKPPVARAPEKASTHKISSQSEQLSTTDKGQVLPPPPKTDDSSAPPVTATTDNSSNINIAVSEGASWNDESAFGNTQFPQGIHDVVEVLCSGEATPGEHQLELNGSEPISYPSPYIARRTGGSYNPTTGMFTVDPIVVYDPSEGENKNVARSCFAWSSIRWVFAQSYMTLSSAVEMSATAPMGDISVGDQSTSARSQPTGSGYQNPWSGQFSQDELGNLVGDPSASLLELLLSF